MPDRADRIRPTDLLPLGMVVGGAVLIAMGTRLPWYRITDPMGSGFGTGMGEHGALFVWLAVLLVVAAVVAEFHRLASAIGLVVAGAVVWRAWSQYADEPWFAFESMPADSGALAQASPEVGSWCLFIGAGLAAAGLVLGALRPR